MGDGRQTVVLQTLGCILLPRRRLHASPLPRQRRLDATRTIRGRANKAACGRRASSHRHVENLHGLAVDRAQLLVRLYRRAAQPRRAASAKSDRRPRRSQHRRCAQRRRGARKREREGHRPMVETAAACRGQAAARRLRQEARVHDVHQVLVHDERTRSVVVQVVAGGEQARRLRTRRVLQPVDREQRLVSPTVCRAQQLHNHDGPQVCAQFARLAANGEQLLS